MHYILLVKEQTQLYMRDQHSFSQQLI